MSGIERLPAPLPLYIAEQLSDLKSLDALRRSCGLFAAIFSLHAVELFEHLMRKTLNEGVVIRIRGYVLLLADHSKWQRTEDAIEHLYERARVPLSRDTPTQAISLALRTFSSFHTLWGEIAMQKLDELYKLPHRHPRKIPYRPLRRDSQPVHEYDIIDDFPYAVPAVSPLHWVEEQRGLQALFHLRNCALLGHDLSVPPEESVRFSFESECHYFFAAFIKRIAHPALVWQLQWQAPATIPSQDSNADQPWASDDFSDASHPTFGWINFHWSCRVPGSPFKSEDWAEYRDLGLGFWSWRRLSRDLELVSLPREYTLPRIPGAIRSGFVFEKGMTPREVDFTWWKLLRMQPSSPTDTQMERW